MSDRVEEIVTPKAKKHQQQQKQQKQQQQQQAQVQQQPAVVKECPGCDEPCDGCGHKLCEQRELQLCVDVCLLRVCRE